MFGSIGARTVEYLENALEDIRGERGHKLEPTYDNRQLKMAEDHIVQAIRVLKLYGSV